MSESHVPAEAGQPFPDIHQTTPDAGAPPVIRDLRGWFYRLFAPRPNCAVLQVGDGFAENWLPNVVRSDLADAAVARLPEAHFDLVVLHYTLGGLDTLGAAIGSASRLLRSGGILAISGHNRLRRRGRQEPMDNGPTPRATGWGFRSALTRSGFSDVALFITHPPGNVPVYLVDTNRLSAREFFRSNFRERLLAPWSPMSTIIRALVELNLMPYLQPGFLVVGAKC